MRANPCFLPLGMLDARKWSFWRSNLILESSGRLGGLKNRVFAENGFFFTYFFIYFPLGILVARKSPFFTAWNARGAQIMILALKIES